MFDFGERLRSVRKENHLTQKQLAEQIGVTERNLRHYELGTMKPGLDVILSILDNINVDANYLLGRTDNPNMLRGA